MTGKFRHMQHVHRAREMAEESQRAAKLYKWMDGVRELTNCPNKEWKPFKLLSESYVNPSSLIRLSTLRKEFPAAIEIWLKTLKHK